jgi:hypothetical protein
MSNPHVCQHVEPSRLELHWRSIGWEEGCVVGAELFTNGEISSPESANAANGVRSKTKVNNRDGGGAEEGAFVVELKSSKLGYYVCSV